MTAAGLLLEGLCRSRSRTLSMYGLEGRRGEELLLLGAGSGENVA